MYDDFLYNTNIHLYKRNFSYKCKNRHLLHTACNHSKTGAFLTCSYPVIRFGY